MKTVTRLLVVAGLLLGPLVGGQENGDGCTDATDCNSGCCDVGMVTCVAGNNALFGADCGSTGCLCTSGSCVDTTCADGPQCDIDENCESGCCGGYNDICQDAGAKAKGASCFTKDGCDCASGICDWESDPRVCKEDIGEWCRISSHCLSGCCNLQTSECVAGNIDPVGADCRDGCTCITGSCVDNVCSDEPQCQVNNDCESGCCGGFNDICQLMRAKENGAVCFTQDGCDCESGYCDWRSDPRVCKENEVCPPGSDTCGEPHMRGLRGQKIEWSGVDGGWYCLVKDEKMKLHVNVRLTAPLPDDFPDRQLITGLSVLSEGSSLVVEARNAYSVITKGCRSEEHLCLADGGLRVAFNGVEVNNLLHPAKETRLTDFVSLTASNLPVECRQFGGDKIWARLYDEMLQGKRKLAASSSTFEEWVLQFDHMAAYDWCTKYIVERGSLADVESNHAVFKIATSDVIVRLAAGVNSQGGDGEVNWDGRVLPDLDFWQMDVGFHGLRLEHDSLSGILGETARPVLDLNGREVMEGEDAIRGTVEDYRVSDALGMDFALTNKSA